MVSRFIPQRLLKGHTVLADPNDHFEWHLTTHGWERGSASGPPPDRVLTMLCEESESHIDCHEIWSNHDRDKINALIAKYGHSPVR